MGGFSIWHWVIVLLVVLVLFGKGRVSDIMGDFGKGIKSFKEGLNEDVTAAPVAPPAQIEVKAEAPVAQPTEQKTGQL
jgi:sec-independent protein translocase protein TatA